MVLEAIRSRSDHDVLGWSDPSPHLAGRLIDGIPVLGNDADIGRIVGPGGAGFVVAVGTMRGRVRQRVFRAGEKAGLTPVRVIHASAMVSPSANIGDGTVVLAGSIVNTHARVGVNTIVNSGALIEHDVILGAHVHVAPGAILCGGVVVGEGAFVGAGSRIREGISIGEGAVVGIGAIVLQDVLPNTVVIGAPARPRLNMSHCNDRQEADELRHAANRPVPPEPA